MKTIILLNLVVLLLTAALAPAATRLVPDEYATIQAAIDACVDGDVVIIAPDTYTGDGNRDIDFLGKAITVRSIDPNEPVVVASTVIDCQGSKGNPHRGFRFHSGEGPDSVIAGLTITNGYGPNEPVGYDMDSAGGAIFCFVSNPTITLCRIEGNHAGYLGGGIYCEESNPILIGCTFSGNSAHHGGGMCNKESSPVVINCTFSGNSVPESGGAILNSINANPIIANCTVSGNTAARLGGGIRNVYYSNPTITNCILRNNSADYGGGINNRTRSSPMITNCTFSGNSAREKGGAILNSDHSSPTITNCTFVANTTHMYGGGMYNSGGSPTLTNCILWGNLPNEIDGIATVSYSNIHGGWPGQGNIDADPLLALDGYHLQAYSPCINTGDPVYIPLPGETDIDGEPRVMGGRVDMGADEFTSTLTPILRISPIEFQFSSYEDGPNPEEQILSIRNIGSGTLNWEIAEDCPWLEVYPPNGESTGQVNEVTLSVDISGLAPDSYNYQLTINAEGAINSPQVVLVTLNLGGSELYVPLEYDTIQAAIDSAIDWDTVIVADGIYGGDGNRDIDFLGKAITVRSENGPEKCIIDCNGTKDDPHRGFYFHSGEDANSVLSGFTITNGYANSGGGIYCSGSSPTITNCAFSGNLAEYGGGMYNASTSSPMLTNCTFRGNSVGRDGGGIYCSGSSPTVTNCTFSENSAGRNGAGMYNLGSCNPTLNNCTFSGNSAGQHGGGISCQYGGGGPRLASGPPLGCALIITNCILWGDTPEEIYVSDGTTVVTYCDVEGGWLGEGNIDADPFFVAPGYWDASGVWIKGNYHLLEDSPCIDAGDPNYMAEPNETDLDGRPRVIGGRIDMGAYETPIPAEVRIVPRTINLTSKGKWIASLFWLPEDYDVAEIDPNSVRLGDEIGAESVQVDEDQQIAVARFSRSEVQGILAPGEVELTVSGELTDGTRFEGTDTIRVIDKGKKK